MRGNVYRLRDSKASTGREQPGDRYAVVVLASRFDHLSTWIVVPTSTRAQPYIFRPQVEVPGLGETLAMCDMATSVDPERRLADLVGFMSLTDMQAIDRSLRGLLDLD